jgi:transposase
LNTNLLDQLPAELRAEVEQRDRALADANAEIKFLREMIRRLRLKQYGASSEKLSDTQLELLDEEPGVEAAEVEGEAQCKEPEAALIEREKKAARVPHPGREELPAHLPRVEEIIACKEEDCRCRQCGAERKVIGYESCEELDVKPAEYYVRVIKREKRACAACEELGVSTAATPAKIIEKGKASDRMVVDVILKKYADHMPLYRQCAILEREAGITLKRMTLCGWVMAAGGFLEAISRQMRAELLCGSYIQADETPVGVQSEQTRGRNHRGYLWEYSRPGGAVIFDFRMGRGREGPKEFLKEFGGVLQSDGYGAYDRIGGKGISHAGCWTHARRGFIEAIKVGADGKEAAAQIVRMIGELYGVEKQAREQTLSSEQRLALRQDKSVPVLNALKEKLLATRREVLPKGAVGRACDYALGQWPRLLVYAAHGEVEIDNNWCENAIRPVAVGRKNWLHIGSEQAGPRIAAIMSIIETCRRLKIPVREYLLDVLPKLPRWPINRIAELTPSAWAAAR